MPFAALLFDLDGTLVDSHHEICLALDRALRDVGLTLSFSQVEALVDGSPLEVIWDTLHPDVSTRPGRDAYTRFATAYRDHYMRDLGHATALFPGVAETLLHLQRTRPALPLSVVSNKSAASVLPLLEAMGIAQHFALTLGSGGTALAPKPAPDLLLSAARGLGCDTARCVMIGDTALDVRAGKRAGMHTIALSYGMGTHAELAAEGADHILASFEGLLRIMSETPA